MKKIKLIVFLILMSLSVNAQNYTDENINDQKTQKELIYLNNSKIKFSNLLVQSTVYVQQVGNNNEVNATLESTDSDVNINQFGNENQVNLDVTANQINAQINQFGNNNLFTDYSYAPQNNYNAQINQNGNNQKIYVSGSNSLSKNIKINATGNNKTIFVNNFQ